MLAFRARKDNCSVMKDPEVPIFSVCYAVCIWYCAVLSSGEFPCLGILTAPLVNVN